MGLTIDTIASSYAMPPYCTSIRCKANDHSERHFRGATHWSRKDCSPGRYRKLHGGRSRDCSDNSTSRCIQNARVKKLRASRWPIPVRRSRARLIGLPSRAGPIATKIDSTIFESWRPGGWEPEIEIAGAEHVSAALERGRGIVLLGRDLQLQPSRRQDGLPPPWAAGQPFQSSHARLLRHQLRHPLSQRQSAGSSRIATSASALSLRSARRLTLCGECARASRTTECVSFTVGDRGRHTASARFLNARLVLATGPLAMAWTTGATVLPVFTLRKEPGQFEVTIGEPIKLKENADGEVDYAAAMQDYADRVIPYALRDPGQWRGWRYYASAEVTWRLGRARLNFRRRAPFARSARYR